MKRKREIEWMQTEASRVTWPKYNWNFDKFTEKLRESIYENFDHTVSKTLEYDEDSQSYWVTFSRGSALDNVRKGMPTFLEIRRNFKIDPQLPMMPQFEEMAEVKRELDKTFVTLLCLHNEATRCKSN